MASTSGVLMRFHGVLNLDALRRAIDTLVDRLRSSTPVAIDPAPYIVEVETAASVEPVLDQERTAGRSALRFTLVRHAGVADTLVLTGDPGMADGCLLTMVSRELPSLYLAALHGAAAAPVPPASAEPGPGHLLEPGAEPEPLLLPTDHARPATLAGAGDVIERPLGPQLSARLRTLAASCAEPVTTVTLAGFQILIGRWTGQSQVTLGLPRTDGVPLQVRAFHSRISDVTTVRELVAQTANSLRAQTPAKAASLRVLFSAEDAAGPWRSAGVELAGVSMWAATATADLWLQVDDTVDGLVARIEYSTELFEAATIERMHGHFRQLLAELAAAPDTPVDDLEMLTGPERHQLLVEWNDTVRPAPADRRVQQLVAEQARTRAEAVAVVAGAVSLTYRELDERANQLAHHLRSRGVGPEVTVGLCVRRGVEMIIGLLGILKAGGAYVPLDPDYPYDRLEFMIRDARMPVLLTQDELRNRLPLDELSHVVCLDADAATIGRCPVAEPDTGGGPEDLAYVIYTSGSTGRPKGVQVEHRSLAARVAELRERYALTAGDAFLQFGSIAFDGSLGQILPTLAAGAKLVLRQDRSDMPWLLEAIREHGVTVCELPPSAWSLLVTELAAGGELASTVRLFGLGGEQVLPEQVKRWFDRTRVPLFNVYGPSETTITATTALIDRPLPRVPIGRPIGNTEVFVVDSADRPVPVGVTGELLIGGVGVARGYLGRPDLTAERFVERVIGGRARRLYRTGDLVRWLPEGSLEFVGRADDQVKLRGHRIELGELESVLAAHPAVTSCAVAVRDNRLYAYCVPAGRAQLEVSALRQWCARSVPGFMVPSGFVLLDRLPVTINGKVDRAALPAPDGERPRLAASFTAPRTPAEAALARVWQEVLGLDRVGVHDSFFDLGGDSNLSIQLITRARQHGIRLSTRMVFGNQTLAAMATRMTVAEAPAAPLIELNPSSVAERTVFCLHEIGGNVTAYLGLAEELSPVARLVGVPSRGTPASEDVVEMATSYWEVIRSRQPEGPYLLAGYSFGGAVALAVAALAEQSGAKVAMLAAVDAGLPVGSVRGMIERESECLEQLSELLAQADSPTALAGMARARHLMRELHLPDAMLSLGAADFERAIATQAAHTQALLRYQPPAIGSPVLLYQAQESPWTMPLAECWSPFAPQLDARTCAGDHFSLLRPPQVTALAHGISEAIQSS